MLSKARNMISILITFFISLMYKGRGERERERERIQYGVLLESAGLATQLQGVGRFIFLYTFISPISLFTLGDLAAVGANYKCVSERATLAEPPFKCRSSRFFALQPHFRCGFRPIQTHLRVNYVKMSTYDSFCVGKFDLFFPSINSNNICSLCVYISICITVL